VVSGGATWFNSRSNGVSSRPILFSQSAGGSYPLYIAQNDVQTGLIGIKDIAPGCGLSVTTNAQIGFSSGQSAPSNSLIVSNQFLVGESSNTYAVASINPASTAFATMLRVEGKCQSLDASGNQTALFVYSTLSPASTAATSYFGICNQVTTTLKNNSTNFYSDYIYGAVGTTASNYTLSNYYGLYVDVGSKTGGGAVTNAYGAYIKTPSFGTNVLSLYAENTRINGTLNLSNWATQSKNTNTTISYALIGGILFQWIQSSTINLNSSGTVTLAAGYTSASSFVATCTPVGSATAVAFYDSCIQINSTTQLTIYNNSNTNQTYHIICIGY